MAEQIQRTFERTENKSSNRLEIVEFLKGYSMFTIVVFHLLQALGASPTFDKIISFGGTGVHLFVLLSGFGLFLSAKYKSLTYLAFLLKRLNKIYIPYILVVLFSAFLSLFLPVYQNSLYALSGHIFLFKMFDESIIGSYGYPLWFISLIIQLYIVFYILKWMLKLLGAWKFILTCLLLSGLWIAFTIQTHNADVRVWNSFFLQYLWEFALGMIIADKYIAQINNLVKSGNLFWVLLIGVSASALYGFLAVKGGGVGKLLNDFPALVGYTLIAVFIYGLKVNWINTFLLHLGKISFSLYLLHFLILRVGIVLLKPAFSMYIILCIVAITTYVSAVFYQKFVNWIYKVIRL